MGSSHNSHIGYSVLYRVSSRFSDFVYLAAFLFNQISIHLWWVTCRAAVLKWWHADPIWSQSDKHWSAKVFWNLYSWVLSLFCTDNDYDLEVIVRKREVCVEGRGVSKCLRIDLMSDPSGQKIEPSTLVPAVLRTHADQKRCLYRSASIFYT